MSIDLKELAAETTEGIGGIPIIGEAFVNSIYLSLMLSVLIIIILFVLDESTSAVKTFLYIFAGSLAMITVHDGLLKRRVRRDITTTDMVNSYNRVDVQNYVSQPSILPMHVQTAAYNRTHVQPVPLATSAQPEQHVQPVQSMPPAQPMQPMQPAQPMPLAQPMQPMQLAQPVQAMQPAQPAQPAQNTYVVPPVQPAV